MIRKSAPNDPDFHGCSIACYSQSETPTAIGRSIAEDEQRAAYVEQVWKRLERESRERKRRLSTNGI